MPDEQKGIHELLIYEKVTSKPSRGLKKPLLLSYICQESDNFHWLLKKSIKQQP